MKMGSKMIMFLVLVVVKEICAEDKTVTIGEFTTKVHGDSGKISIYKGSDPSNGMTIVPFDSLEEVNEAGINITGDPKHWLNTVATLQSSFSALQQSTYGSHNVGVVHFTFTASFPIEGQTASLTSFIYVFTEPGTVDIGGKTYSVKEGDVKFNVKIENWRFCGNDGVTCQNGQIGHYLDMWMEIKGKQSVQADPNDRNLFGLGDGMVIILPNEVTYDGSTTETMPEDFPKLSSHANRETFGFRFRIFDQSVFYDPIAGFDFDSIFVTTPPTTTTPSDFDFDSDGITTDPPTTTTTTPTTITTTTTVATTTTAPEGTLSGDGVKVDVLGKSGKIRLKGTNSEGKSNGNELTVEFDNLREVTSTGENIKKAKHWYNTFANQEFQFSDLKDGEYQGLSVKYFTFESLLQNSATLKVYLYIFNEAGNITNDDENLAVAQESVKFNVEISDWPFCGDVQCRHGNSDEIGSDIELEIVVKGSEKASKKESGAKKGHKYSMGSGGIILSEKYKKDGSLTTMESGYPAYTQQGSKDIFKMKFAKFTSNIVYDPITYVQGGDATSRCTVLEASYAMMIVMTAGLFSGRFDL